METKEIVKALRCCYSHNLTDCEDCEYNELGGFCAESLKRDAAKRLEELEKQNEAMMKELCDKEVLVREAEWRVQGLEMQLDRQKVEKPEWISVEDEPIPGEQSHIFTVLPKIIIKRNPVTGEPAYWMRLEPPKQKEPSFKDVFLKAFPKAIMYNDGIPLSCRASIFGGKCSLGSTKCFECWNQPYFAEGEGEEKCIK